MIREETAEERFRSLFDNALEGIFQTTFDGRLLDANPAFAHIFGYGSPSDMMAVVEQYVSKHTDAKFSHGICPACLEREMKGIETSS